MIISYQATKYVAKGEIYKRLFKQSYLFSYPLHYRLLSIKQ